MRLNPKLLDLYLHMAFVTSLAKEVMFLVALVG